MSIINYALAVTVASLSVLGAAHAQEQRTTRGADAPFMQEMAIASMAEIELGKLAATKGTHAEIKAFGEQMIKDHTQANQELAAIAKKMNVTLPAAVDAKHRELATRLSALSGAAFDREYATAMVSGHEEVLAKLKAHMASGNAAAPSRESSMPNRDDAAGRQGSGDLHGWVAKTTPVVSAHLERARSLQKTVGS